MSKTSILQRISKLAPDTLDVTIERLLEIVPGRVRADVVIDNGAAARLLRGMAAPAAQMDWLRAVFRRLAPDLEAEDAVDHVNQLVIALHRQSNLDVADAVNLMEWLRRASDTDAGALRELGDVLSRQPGGRNNSIAFFAWLFQRRVADESERVLLGALCEHIDGILPPNPQKIADLRRAFESALRRESWGLKGERFEEVVHLFGHHPSFRNLNTFDTRRVVGGVPIGRNYGAAKNFPVFDLLIDDAGVVRLASVADGGVKRLTDKLKLLVVRKDAKQAANWNKVVDELVHLAATNKLPPGLAHIASMTADQASREVTRRSRLLVPPDCVIPLRAIIASREDFDKLVRAFSETTGNTTNPAQALLEIIQPGIS